MKSLLAKYYFFLLSIFFFNCQKENNPIIVPLPEKMVLDEAYGTDATQKMDVFLPEGRSTATTKVVVLIHGGSWSSGDKSDFTDYFDTLKKRVPGYAIFSINYRLATGTTNFFLHRKMM